MEATAAAVAEEAAADDATTTAIDAKSGTAIAAR